MTAPVQDGSRRRWFAAWGLLFGSVVGLGVLEIGLRSLTRHPYAAQAPRMRDAQLVHRMNPAYPEIDAAGFRNERVLNSAEIVAIGDSHTYGYNVPTRDTWPSLLAQRTGKSVYNMGMGGYGFVQYRVLFERALAMSPRRIVLGLYLVNDLADVCNAIVLSRGSAEWATARDLHPTRCGRARRDYKGIPGLSTGSMLERTAIGSALSTGVVQPLSQTHAEWLERRSLHPSAVRIENGPHRTYMKARRIAAHAAMVAVERPAVAYGWAFAQALLREMAEKARTAGVRLDVLLIPSKEWVFHDLVSRQDGHVSTAYGQLVRDEAARVADVQALCTSLSIDCVSALDELRRALTQPAPVYPDSDDGHPLAAGYAAYVQALQQLPR